MIRLQFSTQNDPVSALIRAFGHGPFSHVDAVIEASTGTAGLGLVGARTDGGVQVRPLAYAPFSRVLGVLLPATDVQTVAFYGFMRAQVGKPYDHRAIAAFAVDRDWRTREAWFCSELVTAALEAAGWFSHTLATPANRVTPDDLLLLCSAFVDVDLG